MIIPLNHTVGRNPLPSTLVKLTGCDEIVLIELQGSIIATGGAAGQHVGTLAIDPGTNRPTLRIGHHLLEGVIHTLAKPCAVIARSKPKSLAHQIDENCGPNQTHRNLGEFDSSDPFLESCMANQPAVDNINEHMQVDLDQPGGDETMTTKENTMKVETRLNIDNNLGLDPPGDVEEPNANEEVSYDIITIVRKKIVFAKRPIPIIPSSMKGLGSLTVNPGSSSAGGDTGDNGGAAGGGDEADD